MYSTCLFCTAPLGRNEAVEHFPVGRRLAYDAAKGRLWVVCRACERWNLTPLESRWEAIEEAERLFRATRLRRASDNVSLAEVREGLQLVRVGAPPPLEFAAWRYGDQFGRRRRRHIAAGVTVGALAMAPIVGLAVGGAIGAAAQLATHSSTLWREVRRRTKVIAVVRDQNDVDRGLTSENARCVELAPLGSNEGWDVFVPYGGSDAHKANRGMRLSGTDALRALAVILPVVNADGGSRQTVRDAVAAIDTAQDMRALLDNARRNRTPFKSSFQVPALTSNVALLPGRFRLALEMSLHAEDERRAMEGELAQLEERWRAAEEIAAIADSLLIPPDVERKLDSMKR